MDITNKIKFVLDDQNNKVAVQMDMDVYEAFENIIEDYGLAKR